MADQTNVQEFIRSVIDAVDASGLNLLEVLGAFTFLQSLYSKEVIENMQEIVMEELKKELKDSVDTQD
jgi:hypothetical protein